MGTTADLRQRIAGTPAGGVCRVDPTLGPYQLDVPFHEILPTDRTITIDFDGVTMFTSEDWLANRPDEDGVDAPLQPMIVIRDGTFVGESSDAPAVRPGRLFILDLPVLPHWSGNRFSFK